MTPQPRSEMDFDLLKLRVEYWQMRFQNTSATTHSATQLIYLVDGAILALMGFLIDKLDATRIIILVMSFPALLLAVLNILHFEFIRIQYHWITNIDKRLLQLLSEDGIRRAPGRFRLQSAHLVSRIVHLIIAVTLLVSSVFMFFYGIGYFPILK